MKIRIPVFYQNTLDQRELRTGLTTQLRATPFTSGLIEGTEMTIDNGYNQNNYGYYEFEILGSNLTKLLKLYVSADGTNFSVIDTWGGTNGVRQKEYLSFSGILNQTTTDAPTLTINKNELGYDAPTLNYSDVGTYGMEFTGRVFDPEKTQVYIGVIGGFDLYRWTISTNDITLGSFLISSFDNDNVPIDDALTNAYFEIRVYP